ncbi:hypothetical protein FRC12_013076, partial [Ceratobasidium sp. 428]
MDEAKKKRKNVLVEDEKRKMAGVGFENRNRGMELTWLEQERGAIAGGSWDLEKDSERAI